MAEPLTYSKRQASARLGITLCCFDDWVRRGILPRSIEGTRRWSREAIRQAVERGLDNSPLSEAELALREFENRQAS